MLQVVGQLGTTTVALTRRVECHEDTSVLVDRDVAAEQLKSGLSVFDSPLNHLNLLGNGGKLLFKKTIELIETAPSTALHQTDENTTHSLVVETFITIEDKHLSSEGLTESLNRLGLTGTGGTVGVTTVSELHTHNESQVTLVCERSVD